MSTVVTHQWTWTELVLDGTVVVVRVLKKHKKSVVVPPCYTPDEFVVVCIKVLKKVITGGKSEDNEWTTMLRTNCVKTQ
jgi:hypothetical protein